MNSHRTKSTSAMRSGPVLCILALAALVAGCQSDAQSGALFGAGLGALAGQAIGHNTEATLIGTAIGAGAGYIIGNESDKEKSRYRRSDDYGYRSDPYYDRRSRDDHCDW